MVSQLPEDRWFRSAVWRMHGLGAGGCGEVLGPSGGAAVTNTFIAASLDEVAELLEARDVNPYRVRAYRRAAAIVRGLKQPLHQLLPHERQETLMNQPGIGPSLAGSIEELSRQGKLRLLDHLRRQVSPAAVMGSVAGIGPVLAERIYDQLGIDSLAELHAAALDGRLATIPGMGRKRIRAVAESLRGRGRTGQPPPYNPQPQPGMPPVPELLDVDREYRQRTSAGTLPKIAPRRFNPTGASWLPILRTRRGQRSYTALYSNTARAHEMGATKDWVVIYADDGANHYQCTVITSQFGPLAGKRIVRGRERECARQPDSDSSA